MYTVKYTLQFVHCTLKYAYATDQTLWSQSVDIQKNYLPTIQFQLIVLFDYK